MSCSRHLCEAVKLIDGADLSHSLFSTLDLSGRRLPDFNLNASKIGRLEAYNADLSHADLRDSKIEWSGFWHANLGNAQLQGADLGEMALADANLAGSTGLKKVWSKDAAGASFEGADLSDSNIRIQQNAIGFPLTPFYGEYLDVEDDQPKPKTGPVPTIRFAHADLRGARIRIDGLRIISSKRI